MEIMNVTIRCFLKSYLKKLDNNPVPIPNNKTAARIIAPNRLTNKFILSQNFLNIILKSKLNLSKGQRIK